MSWSVNRLVHISGWGDFQIAQIDGKSDPHPFVGDKSKLEKKVRGKGSSDITMDDEERNTLPIAVADPNIQEQLIFENEPDIMEGEQTWPTEEELKDADENQSHNGKRMVRVPKGMGEYQAAWIIDEEDSEGDDQESLEDEDMEDEYEDNENKLYAHSQENSEDDASGEWPLQIISGIRFIFLILLY